MEAPQNLTCSQTLTTSYSSDSLSLRSRSPTEFALFSQLPPELRLKIWSLTTASRIVTLVKVDATGIRSSTPIPSLLHTCRESRYEALRSCGLALSTHTSPTSKSPSSAKVYLTHNLDTLYIPRYRAMGYDETLRDFKSYLSQPEELDRVQELALDYVETSEKRPWEAYDKSVLIRSFPNLKRFALVISEKADSRRPTSKSNTELSFQDAACYLKAKGAEEAEAISRVSRMEAEFRKAWEMEEGIARDVAFADGKGAEFEKWVLPELRIVGKRVGSGYLKVL